MSTIFARYSKRFSIRFPVRVLFSDIKVLFKRSADVHRPVMQRIIFADILHYTQVSGDNHTFCVTSIRVYARIQAHKHECTGGCTYVRTRITCVSARIYVYAGICVYVHVCVCMLVSCIYACIRGHARGGVYARVYALTRTHA